MEFSSILLAVFSTILRSTAQSVSACATQRECKKNHWVSIQLHSWVTGVLPTDSPCARPSACMLVCLGCGMPFYYGYIVCYTQHTLLVSAQRKCKLVTPLVGIAGQFASLHC